MAGSNVYKGVRTTAVHGGERPDPNTGASSPNIVMSSTYVVDEPAGFSAHDLNEDSPFLYTRWANPTVDVLERKIAALEGAETCACFASGMAAAAAIMMTELSAGDRFVVSDVSYAGVAELARDTLPRWGVEVVTVDTSNIDAGRDAITPNTKLVHLETPANPIMRLTDIAAVCEIAHAAGARVSADSTFSTPLVTRPIEHGVDYVMYSATKYLGGHGDAMGGAVAGSRELISAMRTEATVHYGGIMSPFNAWLIARGMSTLPLRMQAHSETATALAEWLEGRKGVTRVMYPGLKSHPQHELASRQMAMSSGMLTFQVGDEKTENVIAEKMMSDLQVANYAVSLGHHRTLVFWMDTAGLMETSFRLQGSALESYRAFAGDGIFRVSVGIEDAEDLIASCPKPAASRSPVVLRPF